MIQIGTETDQAQSVLIVDDEPHNRRLLEAMLQSEGLRVYGVGSGAEALAFVHQEPPDLILLDVMMPEMNGFEVVERIKENIATRNIPVILVTALDDRAAKMRGLSAGAEDFLSKPVDRAELSVRVRNLLRLKAYGDFHDNYGRILEREVAARTDELLSERNGAQRYLDAAAVLLVALDTEGHITLANRHACTALGWSGGDLLGGDWFEQCVPPETRDLVRAQFEGMLGGDLSIAQNEIVTKSGDRRMIEWRHTVVRDDLGGVTGTLSSGTDVTERNRSAEALRSAEERTRFALENANVGIWDMDCTTKEVRLSAIALAQYGLADDPFAGTFAAFLERVHAEDRDAVTATIDDAIASGEDFSMLNRTVPILGKMRWLRGSGRFKLDEQGRAVRGVGISEDVTERHEMQRQNQQAQKMDAVGRLASGVAHDFNNLLCVVLGWTGLALDDLADADPIRESLNEVVKAGEAAARLTKQLLSFSRQQITDATAFNPNDLVVAMDLMLRRLIGEHIELVSRTDPELGTVRMDRGQLDQVLMNLVVNARDAMPDGGRLLVTTKNQTLDAAYSRRNADIKPGAYVMISVTDTGTGMSDEVKSRIFEPFFTTKADDKGTGLGLATSYGIVTQVGGRIEVESERGEGTTMRVYLPRDDSTEVTAERPPRRTPMRGVETILLVEDELPVRRVVVRMLEGLGYNVVSAGGGDEALQIILDRGDSLKLLLTDVVLAGGINGRILAERVLAIKPAIKVMFISGYTNDAAILRGLKNRNITLVQKPFSAETLGERVRFVLDAN